MLNTMQHILECFDNMKAIRPRIHMIPNEVSASLCADIIAAVGAKPIMAVAPEETAVITSHADALVVNMGQLTLSKQQAIRQSIQVAHEENIPIVVDPVGIGASEFRMNFGLEIYHKPWSGIIKANSSEYEVLVSEKLTHTGVDGLNQQAKNVRVLDYHRVLCLTGEKDQIIRSDMKIEISHEPTRLPQVVGSGCALGALTGALSVKNDLLYASACASYMMAIASLQAEKQAKGYRDYQMYWIDALYNMDQATLEKYTYLITRNE